MANSSGEWEFVSAQKTGARVRRKSAETRSMISRGRKELDEVGVPRLDQVEVKLYVGEMTGRRTGRHDCSTFSSSSTTHESLASAVGRRHGHPGHRQCGSVSPSIIASQPLGTARHALLWRNIRRCLMHFLIHRAVPDAPIHWSLHDLGHRLAKHPAIWAAAVEAAAWEHGDHRCGCRDDLCWCDVPTLGLWT